MRYHPELGGIFLPLLFAIFCNVSAAESNEKPWLRHTIDPSDPANHLAGADGVKLGDVNGDGRLDLVTGWEEGDQVRICVQPEASLVKSQWPSIMVGKVKSAEDAVFADLDGDERLDVVTATEGNQRTLFVHWAPAPGTAIDDESAWITQSFPATKGQQWWMQCIPLDVDLDGDIDLIVGSKNQNGSVTWLKNPGPSMARNPGEWELTRIADAGWIMSIKTLEENGRRTLVYSVRKGDNSGIFLAEMLKEPPWFGKPVLAAAVGEEVMFIDLADYNGDDRPDIIATIRPQTLQVFLQGSELLAPWTQSVKLNPLPDDFFGSVKAVRLAEMNGVAPPELVVSCENANGKKRGVLIATRESQWQQVSDSEGIKFDLIELLDLDHDGDLDIITCEERSGLGVVWYENPMNQGK